MQRWKNAFYLPEEYCFSNSIYSDGWWEKRESKWMESTEKTLPSTAHTNDLMKCNIYKDFVRSMIFFLLCVFFFGFRFGVYYLNNMGEHISISKYRLYDSWHLRSASVYIKRIDECHQHQSLPKFIFTLSFLPLQLFVEPQLSIMMVTMFFFMPLNSYDKNSAFIDS